MAASVKSGPSCAVSAILSSRPLPVQPTGTVTFLFTDIEGSTSQWEHTPEAMQHAFARQEAIVRETR